MIDENKKAILKGLSASPGIAKGKVKVLTEPEDVKKMDEGDILVASFTTPLFTVGIIKASGIVTDKGGLMSHAAIVAREFGIPCVVGTEKATQQLKDGMEVIVDGEKGLVFY